MTVAKFAKLIGDQRPLSCRPLPPTSWLSFVAVAALASACSTQAQAPTTTAPTTTTTQPAAAPSIVINAPVAMSPADGSLTQGWPTFAVADATRTGPAGDLVYRFDVSVNPSFEPVLFTATVPETANQTTFTPPAGTPAPTQSPVYWRAVAMDPINAVASAPMSARAFTYGAPPSTASVLAAQEGQVLWPGAQPAGTAGRAMLGNNWNVQTLASYDGVRFVSPELEELRVFDLIDRGMDPQAAIDWMHANGYPTVGAWFPAIAVVGFSHEYIAYVNGRWDLVLRVGA